MSLAFGVLHSYLCSKCLEDLARVDRPHPDYVRSKIGAITDLPFHFASTLVYFAQTSPVQSIVHHFKYQEMDRLARNVGRILGQQFDEQLREIEIVVPVPLHRARYAERGYNQAEALSQGIAEGRRLPLLPRRTFQRIRPTRSQTALSAEERLENVSGAFALSRSGQEMLKAKSVLLVDDVLTTGATLASAAETLAVASPSSISILSFAAAL